MTDADKSDLHFCHGCVSSSSDLLSAKGDQLGDVQGLHVRPEAKCIHGGGVHHLVFRAGNDKAPDIPERERLTDAILAWSLGDAVVALPDPPTTGAAAEGFLAAARHVVKVITGGADQIPRRVEPPLYRPR